MTTVAPCNFNSRAAAAPIPSLAPVIMITFIEHGYLYIVVIVLCLKLILRKFKFFERLK